MRFLFLGAGAIGTYVGGALALAGHPVSFTERAETAKIIQDSGLTLHRGGERYHVPEVHAYPTPAAALAADEYDVIVCALKSFDTEAAITALVATGNTLPPILTLQNGVENEEVIGRFVGPDQVISGTVLSAIAKPGTGEVVEETLRGIGIDANHPLGHPLVSALNEAGLAARGYLDAPSMKWSKLLTNLQGNATSAIFDLTPAEVFADSQVFDLERAMLRECLAVMAALGLRAIDLPGTAVRALAFATRLPKFIAQPLLVRALGKARGDKMPSFHIDLHSGRGDSEVSYLNGAVARIGAQIGVPAPVNAALTQTLEALTRGEESLDTYRKNPAAFLAQLD